MAKYSRVGAAPKIIVLLLLVLVLMFGTVIWFDYLGIIDAKDTFAPIFTLLGLEKPAPIEAVDSGLLLDQERLVKETEAVLLREEKLARLAEELDQREAELEEQWSALDAREKKLEDREKSFNTRINQYDDERARLEKNSRDLVGMEPEKAVAILGEHDDQFVIDILRITDEIAAEEGTGSMASYWLSLLPADRAARIQRKMAIKPNS